MFLEILRNSVTYLVLLSFCCANRWCLSLVPTRDVSRLRSIHKTFPVGHQLHSRCGVETTDRLDPVVPFDWIRFAEVDSRHGIQHFLGSVWDNSKWCFPHFSLPRQFLRHSITSINDRMSVFVYALLHRTFTTIRGDRTEGQRCQWPLNTSRQRSLTRIGSKTPWAGASPRRIDEAESRLGRRMRPWRNRTCRSLKCCQLLRCGA